MEVVELAYFTPNFDKDHMNALWVGVGAVSEGTCGLVNGIHNFNLKSRSESTTMARQEG